MADAPRVVRTTDLKTRKQRGEKIAMLTAYDATLARLLERGGADVLLVGDSLGMAVLGHSTTVPVTLDEMIHHTRAVVRGVTHALIVADLPFLTYQVSPRQALRNAGRLIQEGGAAAVKLEGGAPMVPAVRRLVDAGIPVMGHLGLLPQAVHQLGGFRRQATTSDAATQLLDDAIALEQAGAFAVVLESIPHDLAQDVTARLAIPTIGIGAGPHCDGQVLVCYDMLGLTCNPPPFARQFARLGEEVLAATRDYVAGVRGTAA